MRGPTDLRQVGQLRLHFFLWWRFYCWRRNVFLVVRVVNFSWNVKQLNDPFVIKFSLHFIHRPNCFFLRFIFDKKVSWICAQFLLAWFYKPVMHYFPVLRKTFQQIFMVILHLFSCHVFGHVSCHGVCNSD